MTLILAMLLDAIMGEPRWLWSRVPHPAVVMGRIVGWLDDTYNNGDDRKLKGTLAMAFLGLAALLLGLMIQAIPGGIIDVVIAAILLAHRSLVQHVAAVGNALRLSLGDAKRAVAKIVGRDTTHMDRPATARAAIESAAENFSDGVIAPAFWFAVGGLPLLLLYKITNTADSMIGYRTPKHADFGWAAARFDDFLNLIPARLTALLIWLRHPRRATLADIRADAALHRSPNAGWPESAMARILRTALAGPRSYDGTLQDFPFVNAGGDHSPDADTIDAAVRTLWETWAMALILLAIIALI